MLFIPQRLPEHFTFLYDLNKITKPKSSNFRKYIHKSLEQPIRLTCLASRTDVCRLPHTYLYIMLRSEQKQNFNYFSGRFLVVYYASDVMLAGMSRAIWGWTRQILHITYGHNAAILLLLLLYVRPIPNGNPVLNSWNFYIGKSGSTRLFEGRFIKYM